MNAHQLDDFARYEAIKAANRASIAQIPAYDSITAWAGEAGALRLAVWSDAPGRWTYTLYDRAHRAWIFDANVAWTEVDGGEKAARAAGIQSLRDHTAGTGAETISGPVAGEPIRGASDPITGPRLYAVTERDRQLIAIRLSSPIRPLDRTAAPVDGLALFDQVRSPAFL